MTEPKTVIHWLGPLLYSSGHLLRREGGQVGAHGAVVVEVDAACLVDEQVLKKCFRNILEKTRVSRIGLSQVLVLEKSRCLQFALSVKMYR